jgi:hypothetical protein
MSTLSQGGRKHATLWQMGSVGGNLAENTFLSRARYRIMKSPLYLIPRSLCMWLSHQAGNVGGDVSGGRIFQVEIDDVVRCTCMTSMLIHLPCSHVIIVCRMRHMLQEGSNYMSSYYSLPAEEKTWEPRFELLLDPLQWSLYDSQDYVPDVATRKMRKGRRKKKHFNNKIDDIKKGYNNDMYIFDHFDQVKNEVHCSICHGEGHTMDRHKEWPKRNRRSRGVAGRRSATTNIIEVSHMNSMLIKFFVGNVLI